jgi:hypothetical protein
VIRCLFPYGCHRETLSEGCDIKAAVRKSG